MVGRNSEVLIESLLGKELPVPLVVHGLLGGSQVFKVVQNLLISAEVWHKVVSRWGLWWIEINSPFVLEILFGLGQVSLGHSDIRIGAKVRHEVILRRICLELILVMSGEAARGGASWIVLQLYELCLLYTSDAADE